MKNKIKYLWIVTIVLLFFSAGIKGQVKSIAATNKQGQKGMKAEQKRQKEKQGIEGSRSKKSSDRVNDKAKYNKVEKRRKKHPEKKIR